LREGRFREAQIPYRICPKAVTVRATDRYGKEFELRGTDLLARAICHECDHLDGKLYTDVQIKQLSDKD